MAIPVSITACYAFVPLEEERLAALRTELLEFGVRNGMKGLVLLATEGLNATVCGSPDAIAAWKTRMCEVHPAIAFKDSAAEEHVYRRWSVKIKPEIVTLRQPGIAPRGPHRHVSPDAWHEMLQRDDVVIVDARNTYETALGTFRGAVDPGIRKFHEFPAAMEKIALPKEKKVLLYCTGGIRCEKAALVLEDQGFPEVYQLEGGILGYLERFPGGEFQGECFVFDHRVAVDRELRPSRTYRLCETCGDPVASSPCPCGAAVGAA